MGALAPDEAVTPLGEHLTAMPVDPRVGKMLVHGALLRCVGPCLTIAAAMGHGRPVFFAPVDKRQEAQVPAAETYSLMSTSLSASTQRWHSAAGISRPGSATRFTQQSILFCWHNRCDV